jgi:hypothetical protein
MYPFCSSVNCGRAAGEADGPDMVGVDPTLGVDAAGTDAAAVVRADPGAGYGVVPAERDVDGEAVPEGVCAVDSLLSADETKAISTASESSNNNTYFLYIENLHSHCP